MSDTVKLIIEIPREMHQALLKTERIISSQRSGKTLMNVIYSAVAKATPLDSNSEKAEVQAYFDGEAFGWDEEREALIEELKAEIRAEQEKYSHPLEIERAIEILDRIGKAESEGKE